MSNIDEFKKLYNFEFEEIKVDSFEEASEKYLKSVKRKVLISFIIHMKIIQKA